MCFRNPVQAFELDNPRTRELTFPQPFQDLLKEIRQDFLLRGEK